MADKTKIPKILQKYIDELELSESMSDNFYGEFLPFPLYQIVRALNPMPCVDGVPVLLDKGEPMTALVLRGDGAVAPNIWWIVGGRVSKESSYLQTIQDKTESELGVSVEVCHDDLIGLADLFFTSDSKKNMYRSVDTFDVGTPTRYYALRIKDSSKIKAGDGNHDFKLVDVPKLLEIKDELHPYVLNGIIAAFDDVYGREWRPAELKDFEFVCNDRLFVRAGTKK